MYDHWDAKTNQREFTAINILMRNKNDQFIPMPIRLSDTVNKTHFQFKKELHESLEVSCLIKIYKS